MTDARITINRGWPGWLRSVVTGYLHELGADIATDARRLAPVKTGHLRNSIYHEVSKGKLTVGTRGVNYALAVEFGTLPHVIVPKNAKALYWPGARHPVGKVNHPGTPAQPYLRPALYRHRGRL